MGTYATADDLVDYWPGFTVDDPDATEAVILAAEKDIDAALATIPRAITGRKLNPDLLVDYQIAALRDAVCAQAQYRLIKGEEFFILYRPEKQSGPDGSVEGKEPYLAPQAQLELTGTNLRGAWSSNRSYNFPNQNIDDYVE